MPVVTGQNTGQDISSLLQVAGAGATGASNVATQSIEDAIRRTFAKRGQDIKGSFAARGRAGSGVAAAAQAELAGQEGAAVGQARATSMSDMFRNAISLLGQQTQREQFQKQFEASQPGFGDVLGTVAGMVGGPIAGAAGGMLADSIFGKKTGSGLNVPALPAAPATTNYG